MRMSNGSIVRGRAVDRAAVLDVAARHYLAGRPIDMSTLAAELGLTASTAEQGWATVTAEYHLALPATDGETFA